MINNEAIAVDISRTHITAVRLLEKDKEIRAFGSWEIGLPQNVIDENYNVKNPELLSTALKQLFSAIKPKPKRVYLSVPSDQLIIKVLNRSKKLSEKDLYESIRLELEQSIPYPLDEAQISYDIIFTDDESELIKVLAVSCHSAFPVELTKAFKKNKLKVDDIEPAPCIIHRSLKLPENNSSYILHIGFASSYLSLVVDNEVKFVNKFNIGGDSFTNALIEVGMNPVEAEYWKLNHSLVAPENTPDDHYYKAIQTVASNLVESLYQIITFEDSENVNNLILTGKGSLLSGLAGYVQQGLGISVELASPKNELEVLEPEKFINQTLAYSLALHPFEK